MEFPRLGQNCSESTCKQLDFLPLKCDACFNIFCGEHISYGAHSCRESYKKDNQVPVCPLCNIPCPVRKGESPDLVVGRHIENDCMSDPAQDRRKVYTNKCSKKGCKQKELVPIKCESCRQNFCLRHRHEKDHDCKGFQSSGRPVSSAGAAALQRAQVGSSTSSVSPHRSQGGSSGSSLSPHTTHTSHANKNSSSQPPSHAANVSSIQGSMSEDEALARALQLSMNNKAEAAVNQFEGMTEQEREDFLLAQALAASEQDANSSSQPTPPSRPQRTVDKCQVQ